MLDYNGVSSWEILAGWEAKGTDTDFATRMKKIQEMQDWGLVGE